MFFFFPCCGSTRPSYSRWRWRWRCGWEWLQYVRTREWINEYYANGWIWIAQKCLWLDQKNISSSSAPLNAMRRDGEGQQRRQPIAQTPDETGIGDGCVSDENDGNPKMWNTPSAIHFRPTDDGRRSLSARARACSHITLKHRRRIAFHVSIWNVPPWGIQLKTVN